MFSAFFSIGCLQERANLASVTNFSPDKSNQPRLQKLDNYDTNIVKGSKALELKNLSQRNISCPLANSNTLAFEIPGIGKKTYKSSEEVNYTKEKWEDRINRSDNAFSELDKYFRVSAIDIRKFNGKFGYYYLGNSDLKLHEPWSTSKPFAVFAAISKARQQNSSSSALVDKMSIGDMISAIHSYTMINNVSENSNALAAYFANVAGRGYITSLLHEKWLGISDKMVGIWGGFGDIFRPQQALWRSKPGEGAGVLLNPFDPDTETTRFAGPDPDLKKYNWCGQDCGGVGNKPLSAIAQSEFMRRITHFEEDSTNQKKTGITTADIRTILYGDANGPQVWGMFVYLI